MNIVRVVIEAGSHLSECLILNLSYMATSIKSPFVISLKFRSV